MSKIKAVIFDMDGTLVDSEELVGKAEIEAFKKFGIPADHKLIEEFRGVKFTEEVKEIGKRFQINLPTEKVVKVAQKILKDYYETKISLAPHVVEVLIKLKKKYLLGLATSGHSEIAKVALTKHNLSNYFNATTFGEDVKQGKPNPEAFLVTANKMGVDPLEVIVVEDTETGIKAAKGAGMKVIARKANHNSSIDFSPADYVVEDLREIPKILTKI